MKIKQMAITGLWRENPALVQMLGLCPLLAVSNTLVNGILLGLITLAVLTAAMFSMSVLRHWLDETIKLPAQIMVIASFVTVADLLLEASLFTLHQRVSLFVALVVTNCAILGRIEVYGRKHSTFAATLDGLMMGLGFLLTISLLSAMREMIGLGSLLADADHLFGAMAQTWKITLPTQGMLLVILPPGAFLCFGCMLAGKNWLDQYFKS